VGRRSRRKVKLGIVRLSDCPKASDAELERVVRVLARSAAQILSGMGELRLSPDELMDNVRLRPRTGGGRR
jgi:hypothetical protein